MNNVAFLVPMTSRGREWSSFNDTYLYNYFIKSMTETNGYSYVLYLGIDSDDIFCLSETFIDGLRRSIAFPFKIIKFEDIEKGHVTKMWNILFETAYSDGCQYFVQCGDDVVFLDQDWLGSCITALKNNNDVGVAGPIDINTHILFLTQSVVSRKHMEIFGYYFPEEIKNWYCDNWINDVYKSVGMLFIVNKRCKNSGGKERYKIIHEGKSVLENIIKPSEEKLKKYLSPRSQNCLFITYGDELFKNSRERILKEAIESEIFENCIAYTPNELEHDFKEKCKVLLSQRRGGGYWCWKSYLLLKTMETLEEGKWILYADAGCVLISDRKNQLLEQIEEMEKSGKMVSAYQMEHLPEKTWTKADLAIYLNALNDKEIMETGQYHATVFLIKNTEQTRKLLEKIKSIMINHPYLIDDSPSAVKNDDTFQEHRHDQSLFSILRKQNKDITYVIPDETYYGNAFVQAMRIRT